MKNVTQEEENTFYCDAITVMTDKYHNLKEETMSIIKAVANNGQVEVMYANLSRLVNHISCSIHRKKR